MPLKLAIERASAMLGSQRELAASLGDREAHISAWKAGTRACGIDKRIKIAQIAGMDPTQAVLEGLAAQLDEGDEWQGKAKDTLNAILSAFPEPEAIDMKVHRYDNRQRRRRWHELLIEKIRR